MTDSNNQPTKPVTTQSQPAAVPAKPVKPAKPVEPAKPAADAKPLSQAERIGAAVTQRLAAFERYLENPKVADLCTWWAEQAVTEIGTMLPRATEYGSEDLLLIGRGLLAVRNATEKQRHVSDQECAEMGTLFYALGKIARGFSAYGQGKRPSEDTLLDLAIYTHMILRIRESGGWPWGSATNQ